MRAAGQVRRPTPGGARGAFPQDGMPDAVENLHACERRLLFSGSDDLWIAANLGFRPPVATRLSRWPYCELIEFRIETRLDQFRRTKLPGIAKFLVTGDFRVPVENADRDRIEIRGNF